MTSSPPPDGSLDPDPVTRLVLDEATDVLPGGWEGAEVLVVDDVDAALTRGVLAGGGRPLAWVDDLREARVCEAAGARLLDPEDGTPLPVVAVLGRLSPAVAAVEDLAERLAAVVPEGVRVVLGGRVKHMTLAQNEALARSFGTVSASRGRQKSRVLHASDPRAGTPHWPRTTVLDEPALGAPLTLRSRGAVFAGGRLDAGTRLLVQALDAGPVADGGDALDLGSGSGVLAVWLARRGLRTRAVDVSAAAVTSTRLAAEADRVAVEVSWADGLEDVADGSLDLVVSNPPFHVGAAKDSTPTLEMIDDLARVLRPGGASWLVWNAHLPYLPRLRSAVGPTEVVRRDRSYLVTRSVLR
ncbi:class I SAM-dependent methyltransferase [Auraticoccus monumenti]|uniref:16S rRNA m(2)G 1207 methyltransferase n=1 Tax=Auraticoccus monumenti TaxID=675864 RepID=A0A1G6VLY6_9ACTN|nr:methyltransferase [Auraticoccus monumenti]SDD54554.1 16S rRNA m(2)G 1207 methyltransferase [Auraticoccus monumenti]